MSLIYNQKSLPPLQTERLRSLENAAESVSRKLKALDPAKLGFSTYGRQIVADLQRHADKTLKKYVHLVAWLRFPELPGGHEAFVDYGAGHGLLGCLAKAAGFRRVIYNDIFDKNCEDARLLGQQLGCPPDEFICGDILAVRQSLAGREPASCALASVNVIEHIYDMDEFIDVSASLSPGPMTLALSTSANPLNPLVRRRHYQQHREWEFQDGPHEGSYPLDTLRAFRTVRREIIQAAAPGISTDDAQRLAEATRGLRKNDIEQCARRFVESGHMPPLPEHPTNTCDPLTGSWQERLLDIGHVSRRLEKHGFAVRVLGGYYDDLAHNPAKRAAARMLNHGINLLGTQGARLAPCFMFHAARVRPSMTRRAEPVAASSAS